MGQSRTSHWIEQKQTIPRKDNNKIRKQRKNKLRKPTLFPSYIQELENKSML